MPGRVGPTLEFLVPLIDGSKQTGRPDLTTVAVVAHSAKTLDGGLGELREELARQGFPDVLWFERPKSRKAARCARRAVDQGADLIFVWGGDGTVQRCINEVAGSDATLAILPAGTGNLLARNLGVPIDLPGAVRTGLQGTVRAIDAGSVNGELFAVMAGVGLDALMIKDADSGMKARAGRMAYIWTGLKNLSISSTKAEVRVDGRKFYKGRVSCVLVGNVGKVLGGVDVFDAAEPDDGRLDVGVITAKNMLEWTRTLGRIALGDARKSPFVRVTQGRRIRVKLQRALPYELDGGARPATRDLRVKVHPRSVRICVPGAGVSQA